MSDDAFQFSAVELRRAPGIERETIALDDLAGGVTLVHGPNASGKTTLGQAVQWLLWPSAAPDRTLVVGQAALNGDDWRIDLDGSHVDYQRNGEEDNGPGLPSADQRDRYWLSLHDLLQLGTRNESFAEQIARESAGGYDVDAVADELGFGAGISTRRKGVVGDAETVLTKLRAARREQDELRDEERRLGRLQTQLREAEQTEERLDLLDDAIDYAETRDEIRTARARLETYPSILEALDGDEIETVEQLTAEIEKHKRAKEEARAAKRNAQRRIDETDLPDGGVPTGVPAQLKALRDDLADLEDDLEDARATLADQQQQRDSARDAIPLDLTTEDLVAFDPDSWEDLAAFVREAEKVRTERELQETVERWLGDTDPPASDREAVSRGQHELEEWLAHPPAAETTDDRMFQLVVVSSGLLAASGVALALLVTPVLGVVTVVGIAILAYSYASRGGDNTQQQARVSHEETFTQLSLEPPSSWTKSDVRARLNDLYDEQAAHALEQERQQQYSTRQRQSELDDREAALEARRTALKNELGAAPDDADIELLATVEGIVRWQAANERVEGTEARIDEIEAGVETKRTELAEVIDPYSDVEVTDAAAATRAIRDLETRADEYDSAVRERDQAEKDLIDATDEVTRCEQERAEVFSDVGLTPGETDRLRELCEQVEAFESVLGEIDTAQTKARERAERLADHPGYQPTLKQRSVDNLVDERDQLEADVDDPNQLRQQITEIERDIENAKGETDIEEAIQARDEALDALHAQYETDAAAMVGHTLVETVQAATRETTRPAVFERAQAILARITTGRYRLDLSRDGDAFRAYDTVAERGRSLNELSSATQLQVLLAVRLAFVEQQEQGAQLPLVLDETLANTDGDRAAVIIESMIELARDGRQIFYFTAQGDEVAKWCAQLEPADGVDHTVVDLAAQRGLDRHIDVPDLDEYTEPSASPPDPGGHDHHSYGELLDVPRFDPRAGAGQTHLWYAVEDIELLAQLLALGVERWGQLDTLLETTELAVIEDREALQEAAQCGAALEEFARSWQQGRGKRVERATIERADGVTDNFVDEVSELARECNGDADQILTALRNGEVSRYHRNKADELEEFFEANGYIDPATPLTPEQVRVRVIDQLVTEGLDRDTAEQRGIRLLERLTTDPEIRAATDD